MKEELKTGSAYSDSHPELIKGFEGLGYGE